MELRVEAKLWKAIGLALALAARAFPMPGFGILDATEQTEFRESSIRRDPVQKQVQFSDRWRQQ